VNGCPALNLARKGEIQVAKSENGAIELKMSVEDRNRLLAKGIWLMELILDEEYYSLKRTGQICDISNAWMRTCLQEGTIAAEKNERGHWRVSRTEVARVWQEELEKHLDRLDRKEEGKKYVYRRPTEWAYHLVTKYVKKKGKVTASQKKCVLAVMEQAKVEWDREYEERKAKKEANKAETEADKGK
jgi:hypothetical protein